MPAVRWNLAISPETDRSVRTFIAERGGGRKGDLSKFVEEAVLERIFDKTLAETHAANAHLSAEEVEAIVDEAITWARAT